LDALRFTGVDVFAFAEALALGEATLWLPVAVELELEAPGAAAGEEGVAAGVDAVRLVCEWDFFFGDSGVEG
jgi:hypothetical protein